MLFLDDSRHCSEILARSFYGIKRLQIPNFLEPGLAKQLYRDMSSALEWNTFLTAGGRKYLARADMREQHSADQDDEINRRAHENAKTGGFSCVYDVGIQNPGIEDPEIADLILPDFLRFLESARFLNFLRLSFDLIDATNVDVEVQRFRPGHFVSYHRAQCPPQAVDRCRAIFQYNLTPEWKVDWGGLLTFRGDDGTTIVSYPPNFNTLDVFACPQGHWTTLVTPFSSGHRFTIVGNVNSLDALE